MRQRFLREFDSLWFDCLNGDSRETGKLTPEGKPDPSVFSTEYNREGIRVGTAIGTLVRRSRLEEAPTNSGALACPEGAMEISRGQASAASAAPGARAKMKSRPGGAAEPVKTAEISGVPAGTQSVSGSSPGAADAGASLPPANFRQPAGLPKVFFRQFWGTDKRAELLESLNAKKFAKQYESVEPTKENRFIFLPSTVAKEYLRWPTIVDLLAMSPIQRSD